MNKLLLSTLVVLATTTHSFAVTDMSPVEDKSEISTVSPFVPAMEIPEQADVQILARAGAGGGGGGGGAGPDAYGIDGPILHRGTRSSSVPGTPPTTFPGRDTHESVTYDDGCGFFKRVFSKQDCI